MEPKISVILPVYNESKYIDDIFNSVLDFSNENPNYRFIFVNDGSVDETEKILKKKIALCDCERINLLSYNPNKGKGYAVKKGVEYSDGDYVIFTDGDLAYSLNHLKLFVQKLRFYDVVIGCRPIIRENIKKIKISRKIFGKSFNFLVKLMLNLNFTDTQAGIKGFRKEAAKNLFQKQKINGFGFDVEIITLANKMSYSISELPVIVSDSHKNMISNVSLIKDSVKMFFNILKIKFQNH